MSYESIQEMFSRTAAELGSQVAIDRGGLRVTYAELEAESNRLANFLLEDGLARGSMVGLFTDDPIRIITGILAVLKAGAVFVPLDPTFPDQRLQEMSNRVQPGWYVTERTYLQKLGRLRRNVHETTKVVCLDDGDYTSYERREHPGLRSDPEAPCSIYFTSGSTGKPKAILGRLKGIDHFMRWEIEAVGARPGTRVSQLALPSFDGFLKDAFVPLCSGGTVCAPESREIVLDSWLLTDWLDSEQVELLHCVPSLFRALLNKGLNSHYFEALKYVVLTGEPLYPADVKRWMDVFGKRIKLLNIYGTTETTLSKFAYEVKPEDVERPSIPVGKPIKGSAVLLINSRGQLCREEVVGEIHIQTAYRSWGYYGEPQMTQAVFIQNPFSDDPADIVHKTGDYGRLLKSGDLEHLGRRDQQVQIRGIRIELGEIENLLRGHEAVADVAVIDRDDAAGNKFLVAYVTLGNGGGCEPLRQYLSERLPETMLPSAFVEMDQLPRTLNGKIDRTALPTLRAVQGERDAGEFMLRTPVEEIVAGIWCEVLRLPAVGRTDNFFKAGGHSLLAMQVVLRVRDILKVELSVRHMFELPTVAHLSQLIEKQISAHEQIETMPIESVSREGDLPLSFSQQRLWFIEQLSQTTAFHIPLEVKLKGSLNRSALEQAVSEIIRRHEILRTSFPSRNGEPFQVLHAPLRVRLPVVDLHGQDPVEQEATARSLSEAQLDRPFDLTTGPLTRITLLRYSDEEHMVLCTLHHIISDGWSKGLLVNEISTLYEAFSEGRPSPLKELTIQYADFAAWQRRWLAGEALDQELAHWKENLAKAPPLLPLATDRPRPPVQTFNGATEAFTLSKDISEKLKALSQQRSVTLFMTLLAAFQVLLHRYTSQDDLVVGTTVANRERTEVEGLIGFFVNMLALRVDCSANPPFDELLKRVRETTLTAYVHQRLPFEKLVEELQPERNLSYPPLFQVIFSFQNQPTLTELMLPGLRLSFPQAEVTTSQCDLLLDMAEGSDGLAGGLQYNSDLFDQSTAARMVKHFRNLLAGIATDSRQRLSELPLLTEDEQIETLTEWNQTEAEYPANSCIHELFERRVETAPDSIAAVFRDHHLSYSELNRRANQIARYLRLAGVKVGDLVGIHLEHSFEELAGLLGVLKTGAAYLPLDQENPAQRLSFLLADAGLTVVLTQQSFAGALLAGKARLICLDSERDFIAAESDSNLNAEIPVKSIAYVIYTSGSTGEPKGVAVSHRALVNYIWWAKDTYLRDQELAFPLYSSLAFDLTATSIFVPLTSGNSVLVYRPESNLAPLLEILRENQAGIVKLTPGHLTLIKEEDNRQSRIRRLIVGGEALRTRLAWEIYESFEGVEIYNEYGPTEATVGCMIYKFDPVADKNTFVPIGQPAPNMQIYVLDRGLSPVAENMIGEIYIAGDGLSEGYRNRSELTAERFLPNPFTTGSHSGQRMYRTGDLARRRSGGALEFLGRNDEQVKIRGFRVEPGEIEAALGELPEVAQAVVIAREDHPGEKALLGYVVAAPGFSIDAQAVRRQLAQRLPSYLVPAAIVTLAALPLTLNGKLDRQALPQPEFATAVWRPPRTPQEEILCSLFAETLNLPQVGIDDSFFELGGHSLLATRLVSLVRATLDVELPIRSLFESPTVAQLSLRLREAGPVQIPLRPQPRGQRLPLSYAQQRLWFLDQFEGGSPEYNMPVALRLRGALEVAALHQTINLIVARHESLRTHFAELDGEPMQVIATQLIIDLPLEDLSRLDQTAQQARVMACLASAASQPFDLGCGPVLRLRLLKLSPDHHILLRTMHHIVSDGWSEEVFSRELAVLYQALRDGRPNPLPPLTVQYADFAIWQRQLLEAEVGSDLSYWTQQLAGIPERLELPTDRPRPAQQTFAAEVCQTRLTAAQAAGLKQLGRSHQATLYMTLLAIFAVLLERYSGQDDIVVGSPVANRQEAQLEDLIGFFVNMLCLRVRVKPQLSFGDLLKAVRQTALEAYEHQNVPFERLVEELAPQRSLNSTPVFQVAFALQNAPPVQERVKGLEIESLIANELRVRYDLEVHAWEERGEIGITWIYNPDLFDRSRIEQMGRHYLRLLAAVVDNPEQRLGSIELLDAPERCQLLEQWNDTALALPPAMLPELFATQVSRTPDALAVVSDTQHLSYAELNRRANQLAHYLQTLSVSPEAPVAILLARSPELVISMLAVLKAGAAYLPLDPAYPTDRLSFMMENSRASVLICQALPDRLPRHTATVVNLDSQVDLIAQQSEANPTGGPKPEDLSHIIYTSGSTGRPKGATIEHAGTVNLLQWAHRMFTNEELSGVLASTSICFDLSVFEIFAPLTCGGTVILADDAINLATLSTAERVTLINTVPSALTELLRLKAVRPSVCTVNLAGEVLKQNLVRKLYAETKVARVLNLYGPTEYTTYTTAQEVGRGDQQEPAIGRPIANSQVYIVDTEMRPVPIGVVGEICIGGRGLAQSYLDQPELTAERFIPDDLSGSVGRRLFRSGDLGKYLENGEIDYLGRKDQQVKVRGFRVEPGEIEAALAELPEVAQAVVIARQDQFDQPALVCYVVAAPGCGIEAEGLRQQLAERLPEYMVPTAIVTLSALPLTANGKLDRQALPPPNFTTAVWRAPGTPQEEILCGLFTSVLHLPRVGLDDNFFALGGHSLLATRLVSLVRATLDVELPIRTLFESPTVAQLSLRLCEATPGRLPLRPQSRPERLPLSYAQQRLWFLDQLQGVTPEYNMPVALRLRGSLRPDALRQAVQLLVTRHEILRTHFADLDGEPWQVIAPTLTIDLPLEDLSILDAVMQQARVQACLANEANEPFDLGRGPLLRLRLLKLGKDDHILLRTMHHIVSDGWSEEVFSRELALLYQAACDGRDSHDGPANPLPPLTIQYADFALWQRQWLEAGLNGGLAYWTKQLAGIPERLELPADRPRAPRQTFAAEACQTRLTAEQTAALKQLSQSQQTTLYMTLLAAFALLLERYSGQDDIVVGSPIANRQEAQLEDLIGFFVNTLCLRVRVKPELSFSELLSQVRRTALEAYEHQDVPFERLVEELAPPRSLNLTPVFQVAFALQNAPRLAPAVAGLEFELITGAELRVRYDLEVHVWEEQEELGITWIYNRDLFDRWRMEQMGRHYLRLLEAVVSNPKQRLGSIELLDTPERQRILEQWNDTALALPPATLPQLFATQVGRTPDALAVVSETQHLSYAELNHRANRLAHLLIAQGIGPEDIVALAMPFSTEMLVSLLGILKAGAAYLPIDIEYPAARMAFMLADAAPACVITLRETVACLPDNPRRLILNDPDTIRALAECAPHNPKNSERARPLDPNHPAYVIYTSGSTGQPKGAVVTHPSVQGLVNDFQMRAPLGPGSRCSLWTSSSFDASVYELFSALLYGCTLCIPSEDSRLEPNAFLRWLSSEAINSAYIPVFMLPALAAGDKTQLDRLFVGAEPISEALLRTISSAHPELRIINAYGPTEATVCATLYNFPRGTQTAGSGTVPIGTPLKNTQVYVLDDALNPVPVGVIGELFIGGAGLARGYLQRPDLTAERFVAAPFGQPGARLYRTGDRVRWRHDANLEFLGRVDTQIKLRGLRVEPGEIEATLCQHPSVREAVVMARQDVSDDKRLVAYVVPQPLPPRRDSDLFEQTNQVEQWQALFDEVQTRALPDLDPTFNIIGWQSSYTGQPIPQPEMREWLEATVARILSLRPQRVLEIGCGTGLLLFRIAPSCTRYLATDFSAATLAQLQRQLTAGTQHLPQVTLLHRSADNFSEIEPAAFDTIILNSISQYFPNVDYLMRVLAGAVSSLKPGGTVFIGDVRSLPLLSAFHAAVLLSRAEPQLSKAQFAQRLHKQVRAEKELVIDPTFFTALKQHLPGISRIAVQLKQGRHHNELTQFRYDVTLQVGSEAAAPAADLNWLDWQTEGLTLTTASELLETNEQANEQTNEQTNPKTLAIAGVPNARLQLANHTLAWLDSDHGPDTVGEFRESLPSSLSDSTVDPEAVWALCNDLPYDVTLSWSTADAAGRYDVLFHRRGAVSPPSVCRLVAPTDSRPLSAYANDPLRGNFYRQLTVTLRRFLQERLPDYMVPSAFMVLESWPLTPSRKIDRRALPPPDQARPELEKAYVAPRNSIEEVLTALWANVLGLDRVGIHDNFFDLGGHSLLATQLISRARNIFQVELPLRWVFDASTAAAFSQTLIANEPQPDQTAKIARTFLKVKAMKLEERKRNTAAAQ